MKAPVPTYRIHGLTVTSAEALPGLIAADAAARPDLSCEFFAAPAAGDDGTVVDVPAGAWGDDHALVRLSERPDGVWRVRYADDTTFDITADGRSVAAYTPVHATLADTLTYLYGPVLALVLRMRGVLAFHASAAVIDDAAVLFIGGNGAGKSTLAAGCARAGLAVLSDDVVAVREDAAGWWASPSYDHVRLWPAAEAALFGAGTLPLLTPTWDKRLLPLRVQGYAHAATPCPVRAAFVLGERDATAAAIRVAPIAARDALLSLVGHAAASRLMTTRLRAMELTPLGRFAAACPPRQLVLPDDMNRLPRAVADLVALLRRASA